jgi:hypothetical protein
LLSNTSLADWWSISPVLVILRKSEIDRQTVVCLCRFHSSGTANGKHIEPPAIRNTSQPEQEDELP